MVNEPDSSEKDSAEKRYLYRRTRATIEVGLFGCLFFWTTGLLNQKNVGILFLCCIRFHFSLRPRGYSSGNTFYFPPKSVCRLLQVYNSSSDHPHNMACMQVCTFTVACVAVAPILARLFPSHDRVIILLLAKGGELFFFKTLAVSCFHEKQGKKGKQGKQEVFPDCVFLSEGKT